MHRRILSLALVSTSVALAVAATVVGPVEVADSATYVPSSQLTKLGGDDFNGSAGYLPNQATWYFNTGGNGWGNGELQQYTGRASNVSTDGMGNLRIIARKETYRGSDGITRNYTSARITTRQAVQYGRIEARMKLPAGVGLWPAFWTVGQDILTRGWPASGEIDILESVNDMSFASGTVHGLNGTTRWKRGGYTIPTGGLANSWHVYAVDWTRDQITWYLDGVPYVTVTRADAPAGAEWPFDKPHFIQFNLAVGGEWPGTPAASTVFPATLLIDYVRVYKL